MKFGTTLKHCTIRKKTKPNGKAGTLRNNLVANKVWEKKLWPGLCFEVNAWLARCISKKTLIVSHLPTSSCFVHSKCLVLAKGQKHTAHTETKFDQRKQFYVKYQTFKSEPAGFLNATNSPHVH